MGALVLLWLTAKLGFKFQEQMLGETCLSQSMAKDDADVHF